MNFIFPFLVTAIKNDAVFTLASETRCLRCYILLMCNAKKCSAMVAEREEASSILVATILLQLYSFARLLLQSTVYRVTCPVTA